MLKAFWWTALFFSALNPLLTAIPSVAEERLRTVISYKPLRKDFHAPLVQIRLNERFTGAFLFDTGANISVISDVMTVRMGLSPKPAMLDGKPLRLQDGSWAEIVTIASLELGMLPITDAPLVVMKANWLHSIVGEPIDGIIGGNALVPFAALFDFQQHQITLWYPGGLSPDELKHAGFADSVAVPIKETEGLSIRVRFNKEVEEDLVIDTGAARTVISNRLARQLRLKPIERDIASQTFFGKVVTNTTRIQRLSIGDMVINDVIVAYPQSKSAHFPPHIGLDILAQYRVLIDFPQKRLYLKPASSSAEKPSEQKEEK